MRHACAILTAVAVLAACSPAPTATTPLPVTPPGEAVGAAVVRKTVLQPPVAAAPLPAPGAAPAAIVIPPGALYVCVSETAGVRHTTAIEFAPKVGAVCAKDPEMSPCQYERNVCRKSGGRVYAANGTEITMATEALYDKKVMRILLRSN